jgi:hypothetical protein
MAHNSAITTGIIGEKNMQATVLTIAIFLIIIILAVAGAQS